ncbi:GNAT family N-acetyltransferase [Cupriavidus sp. WGtm5]|uniref:GNAT family N-acetyltransferase n=1 Tax=Cupriavidus sp. WGtm5 TaxID=2919926 RepID=UPI002091AF84|nr:GNAT family N-acetyltransferase [Cupriavidus sp. WGtm5]MCO4888995.1 GNAT family N-acetyltransferase [Cupriavidus sp. WGtm5]
MTNLIPNFEIRPALPSDAQAVEAILIDTHLGTWKPQLTPAAAAAFELQGKTRSYVEARLQEFRVACVDGVPAAMVDWEHNFIWALHVGRAWQRMGLGAALLAHAEAEMARAGQREARLETDTFNQQSRAFYRRQGYAEIDFYPDESWDSGFTTVLLSKALAPV